VNYPCKIDTREAELCGPNNIEHDFEGEKVFKTTPFASANLLKMLIKRISKKNRHELCEPNFCEFFYENY